MSVTVTVIVVDDDELDRYVIKRQLAKIDIFGPVVEMPSGDSFLETCLGNPDYDFAEKNPALVLMDINMPGSDGFETVEKAAQEFSCTQGPANLVFVILSSSDSLHDKEKASSQSLIKGFLSKPVDLEGVENIRDLYISESGYSP